MPLVQVCVLPSQGLLVFTEYSEKGIRFEKLFDLNKESLSTVSGPTESITSIEVCDNYRAS